MPSRLSHQCLAAAVHCATLDCVKQPAERCLVPDVSLNAVLYSKNIKLIYGIDINAIIIIISILKNYSKITN